jgi:hypothetical protein
MNPQGWLELPAALSSEHREDLANRFAEKSLDILSAEGPLGK